MSTACGDQECRQSNEYGESAEDGQRGVPFLTGLRPVWRSGQTAAMPQTGGLHPRNVVFGAAFKEGTVRAAPYPLVVTVLGIDPGTAACGFGVVQRNGSRLTALDHGWWSTPPGERPELRLKQIYDRVAGLVGQYEPQMVVIEESYVGVDARTALSVGQARGAALTACANAGVPCCEYPPSTVKQAVCGYGRADKAQVQRMVKAILRLADEPTPHHAADALAVAICHALASPLLELAGGR